MPGPRVLLVVTGSIAAYKACEVVRRLQDRGVEVRVAMTRNAGEFVSPLTFAALSGHRVLVSSFDDERPERIPHVRWAEESDAFCVVPASADFIAKMALGIADDFSSTLHLAFAGPVLVAPAMEDQMWRHPAVRENVDKLSARGVVIVQPTAGPLASGRHGLGRLAEPPDVVDAIMEVLVTEPIERSLAGMRVLVSAGPTHEHFDPVRVLTNPSTGKMGYAVARAAARLGADVILVSGPTQIVEPAGVEIVRVVNAEEMRREMVDHTAAADIVVMAAAVSDFRPVAPVSEKLQKSAADAMSWEVERTPDILEELRRLGGRRTLVGFAAETSDLEARAREKLDRKGCDLMVANLVEAGVTGFEVDTNEVVILDRLGGRVPAGPAPKSDIAFTIIDAILGFRQRLGVASREKAG
ncbi:MAG: bifunctional phosphopantothenoylcysteine decarboxylase/phosphopantothenate--cysteine ligase CoaBC [Acidobacteria bacterium]|nr:bifunctional phosphopantothenoylcysteine decarboxylase/phosphopantothenate--cysteine ligase CoaBC [Acidobacteriota bacterium]